MADCACHQRNAEINLHLGSSFALISAVLIFPGDVRRSDNEIEAFYRLLIRDRAVRNQCK
jgi:hypothetical protein